MMTAKEYREEVLKAILNYEKQFDPVDENDISNEIGCLYEIVRAIPIEGKEHG